jgi:O-antigen/teichoic acid export membrane protein
MRFLASLIEQGLGSVLTFAINLWLIRNGTQAAFGVYMFWYTVAWMLGTLQSTLATTHLFNLPSAHDQMDARREPERFLLSVMLVLAALAAIGVAIGNAALGASDSNLFAPTSILFVATFLTFQYARAFAFSRQRPKLAATLSACVLFCAAAGLGGDFLLGHPPTAERVMAIVGVAYGVSALGVVLVLLGGMRPMLLLADLRRNAPILKGSVWMIVGAGSAEVTNRLYSFAVVGRFGAEALASLSVVQQIIKPAWMLAGAWASIGFPQLSACRNANDRTGFLRSIRRGMVATLAGSLAWSTLVLLGWGWISGTLYGGKYADVGWLAYLWGANVLLGSVNTVLNTAMLALGLFRKLAVLDLIAACIVIASVFVALHFSYAMVILATLAGQLTQASLMSVEMRKRLRVPMGERV